MWLTAQNEGKVTDLQTVTLYHLPAHNGSKVLRMKHKGFW